MSAKKQIFQKLKKIRDYDESVKHVGLWHDSMLEPNKLEQFNTPALMLEFSDIAWIQRNPQMGKTTGRRDANTVVKIHVLYKCNKSAIETFEASEDLRDSILRFLPLWNDTQFNQPFLTDEKTEHSNDVLHDLTLSFNVLCFEPEQAGYRTIAPPEEVPTLVLQVNGKV